MNIKESSESKVLQRMKMEELIYELVEYGNREGLIPTEDIAYRVNVLAEILDVTGFEKAYDFYLEKNADRPKRHVAEILSDICDEAYASGILKENSITYRDLFDTKVMGAITPPPSEVQMKFHAQYRVSPEQATDFYYHFSKATNYIRTDRIVKDEKWVTETE